VAASQGSVQREALGCGAGIASAQFYEADTGSGRILEFTPSGVESFSAAAICWQ
jgi:hypothetical protein